MSDPLRALGAEIRAFYDAWPMGDEWYHDDDTCTDERGDWILNPDEEYSVDDALGIILWQGSGPAPRTVTVNGTPCMTTGGWGDSLDPSEVFLAWRGDRSPGIMIRLTDEQLAELAAFFTQKGWEKTW